MIKEIERRCDFAENGGGHFSITAVVADMLIEDAGEKKYLTCCWVDEAPDIMSYEVSAKELYEFYLDLDFKSDECTVDEAKASVTDTCTTEGEEYEGVYQEYFRILAKMVKEKIVEEGLFGFEDDFDEEEDED